MKNSKSAHVEFAQSVELVWQRQLPILKLFEVANSLSETGHDSLAAVLYQTWIKRNRTAHDHLVLFNLGLVYERLGKSDAAIAQWLRIESMADAGNPEQRPLLILALNNLGRHYEDIGRYAEALAALTKSLRLQPEQPDATHHWVFLRAKQCVWPVYEALGALSEEAQRKHTSALAMITLSEDPVAQLAAAQNYVKN